MKYLSILAVIFSLISCSENTELPQGKTNIDPVVPIEIPNKSVDISVLTYNNLQSEWLLNDELYSGYAISHYSDSTLKQKFGIFNGRKQNEAIEWYPNGTMKSISHYHAGRLHGENKKWGADSAHILISHLNYSNGKLQGVQKKWYVTGEPFKILNMNEGVEEGMQKAFRKNGVVFANYEAKNGRIFGMKKAALCFDLEDEKVVYEE